MSNNLFKRVSGKTYAIIISTALILLLILSYSFRLLPLSYEGRANALTDITYSIDGSEETEITLPVKINNLSPRTPVTLYAKLKPEPYDILQIKSVFSPMILYIDDLPIFEWGQRGTYPAFMNDPPTIITTVPLPASADPLNLRIEYQSPSQRTVLSLPAIYTGSQGELLTKQFKENGFSLLFSFILVFTGLYMVLVYITLSRKIPSGILFLWLGLFSISAGIWVFGECDLSAFIVARHSLLYVLDYLGLFTVAIPFLKFGLAVLNPANRYPIQIMLSIHYSAVCGALLLQLTGKIDFIKSLYLFHIITPLGFALFALCLIWEATKHKNPSAKRFGPAVVLLASSTILELINYWIALTDVLTMFFQLGVFAFVIALGVASGQYIRESVFTKAEKERLEYEMSATAILLDLQRQQYAKISETQAAVKAQRHDIRHQLAVISGILNKGEYGKLKTYIDTLISNIPSENDIPLSENYAVNAIASYYYNLAKETDIEISVGLVVPSELNSSTESDLCIIIGNLLENAIEGCGRMDEGRRFIKLSSHLQYDTLTITVDNSFAGDIRKKSGVFLSSKRDGEGIGISSVIAVAQRLGGGSKFETESGIFKASVYIKI